MLDLGLRRNAVRAALVMCAPLLVGAAHQPGDLARRLLDAHNGERARIGVPPLVWSGELAASAETWAGHLSRTGRFEHSPEASALGENLWAGTSGYFTPERMVDAWIREKKFFKPGAFPANSITGRVEDVGHYTQLVWRGSRRVGCAVARGPVEDVLVCRYDEGGNVVGESPF